MSECCGQPPHASSIRCQTGVADIVLPASARSPTTKSLAIPPISASVPKALGLNGRASLRRPMKQIPSPFDTQLWERSSSSQLNADCRRPDALRPFLIAERIGLLPILQTTLEHKRTAQDTAQVYHRARHRVCVELWSTRSVSTCMCKGVSNAYKYNTTSSSCYVHGVPPPCASVLRRHPLRALRPRALAGPNACASHSGAR